MPTTMRAAQVAEVGADFELIDRPIPEPAAGQVRVKVEAHGICNSDAFVQFAAFPGLELPLKFSALPCTKPVAETYPLSKVNEAFERMITNQARFRVVLTMD